MNTRPIVLVVDDNVYNRTVIRATLESTYDIREAVDGPTALAFCEKVDVDIVLLDVMMPGMDGFEVCRRLKAQTGEGIRPVLLVTALTEAGDRHTGLAAGADDFITKPIDRHELTLRVGNFVKLRRQHQALVRQHETLLELSALKDDLVSLMVHDLRNPLSGVHGVLQILEGEVEDSAHRADIQHALIGTRKLQEILADLLQVRLLEEKRLELRLEELDVLPLVTSAIQSVEAEARLRQVALVPPSDQETVIRGDRVLLRRAVENLLSNAVKYSPPGKAVEIWVRSDDSGVKIEVADRGRGISADQKVDLFEKFGGATRRTPTDRRSYGLGLYFVRLVAEAHSGRVDVMDREGGGVVLSIAVPRSLAMAAAA